MLWACLKRTQMPLRLAASHTLKMRKSLPQQRRQEVDHCRGVGLLSEALAAQRADNDE